MNTSTPFLSRDTEFETEEKLLALLEQKKPTKQDLEDLWLWLQETDFSTDPSRAWVGELAIKLLRLHGDQPLKHEIQKTCKRADGWLLYFCLLGLMDQKETEEFRSALTRAATSPEVTIRAFAEEMIWSLKKSAEFSEASSVLETPSKNPDESVFIAVRAAILRRFDAYKPNKRQVALDRLAIIPSHDSAIRTGLKEESVRAYRSEIYKDIHCVIAEEFARHGF